jgi:hypothetical protein
MRCLVQTLAIKACGLKGRRSASADSVEAEETIVKRYFDSAAECCQDQMIKEPTITGDVDELFGESGVTDVNSGSNGGTVLCM